MSRELIERIRAQIAAIAIRDITPPVAVAIKPHARMRRVYASDVQAQIDEINKEGI